MSIKAFLSTLDIPSVVCIVKNEEVVCMLCILILLKTIKSIITTVLQTKSINLNTSHYTADCQLQFFFSV